uniref:Uncharacterized protein n=1 Tax=Candidatus Methanogaster sp. ANME-2c ERB4 TaxID=2759911 RepID=A0A7G9YEY3_9EURY|nr:hypothetical protein FEDIIHJE_00003 [Methanosarcinales archaeon ANME-2c ERB4]
MVYLPKHYLFFLQRCLYLVFCLLACIFQFHIVERKCYIGSHLRKDSFFLLIYSDLGCKQYGKQSEEPARVLDTDDRSFFAGTHTFKEAISTLPGFAHDYKTVFSGECVSDTRRMIAANYMFTETGDIFWKTRTLDHSKGFTIL